MHPDDADLHERERQHKQAEKHLPHARQHAARPVFLASSQHQPLPRAADRERDQKDAAEPRRLPEQLRHADNHA